MRLHINLSPNTTTVPFNYQKGLVSTLHQWLGPNPWHDDLSLYSLSWLSDGNRVENGFEFPDGCQFFISTPMPELLERILSQNLLGRPLSWGMMVSGIQLQPTPDFGPKARFKAQSPILIKRMLPGETNHKYFFPNNPVANLFLTETLNKKLTKAGLPEKAKVMFDPTYSNPKIRKITYNRIEIKAALCPVVVEGSPKAVAFAWEVGIGNSTGIGFGAVW